MSTSDIIGIISSIASSALAFGILPMIKSMWSLRQAIDDLRSEIYKDYVPRSAYERDRDRDNRHQHERTSP